MTKRWGAEDLRKKGINVPPPAVKGVKIPASTPKGILHIESVLLSAGVDFQPEYRFHYIRKFRFDFAIPGLKIAIEYEGLHSAKSGHTTVKGYNSDLEKYNLATVNGWRVLRYSANNYQQFQEDLNQILNK